MRSPVQIHRNSTPSSTNLRKEVDICDGSWPARGKFGLSRRVAAAIDLPHLREIMDEIERDSSPSPYADDFDSDHTPEVSSDFTVMPRSEFTAHDAINDCAIDQDAVEQSREEERDDEPFYFVCRGKLITFANDAAPGSGSCVEPNSIVSADRGQTPEQATPGCHARKVRHRRNLKRGKTVFALRSIFTHGIKRKRRKHLHLNPLAPSFARSRTFEKASRHSPVLAYAQTSKTVRVPAESQCGYQKSKVHEKWLEHARVRVQLNSLQLRHDQKPRRTTPDKHSCLRRHSAVYLQIIEGIIEQKETERRARRASFLNFIRYWNWTADWFWMKKGLCNWLSKVLCFSKVNRVIVGFAHRQSQS